MGRGMLKSSFPPRHPKKENKKLVCANRPMAVCQNLCIFFRVAFAGRGEERIKYVVFAVCPRVRGIALRVRLLFVFYYYYYFLFPTDSPFRLLSPSPAFRPIVFQVFRTTHRPPNVMDLCRTGRSLSSAVDDSTYTRYQILSIRRETGVFRCVNRKRYSFCKKKHSLLFSNRESMRIG